MRTAVGTLRSRLQGADVTAMVEWDPGLMFLDVETGKWYTGAGCLPAIIRSTGARSAPDIWHV